jgi:hypothetical protein
MRKIPVPVQEMNLIDWFAGQALGSGHNFGRLGDTEVARLCYDLAETMMEERARRLNLLLQKKES